MELLYTFVDLSGREQPHEVLERRFTIDESLEGHVAGFCCEPLGGPMPKALATAYFELWRIDNRRAKRRLLGVPLVFLHAVPANRIRGGVLSGDELLMRITCPAEACTVLLALCAFIDQGPQTG